MGCQSIRALATLGVFGITAAIIYGLVVINRRAPATTSNWEWPTIRVLLTPFAVGALVIAMGWIFGPLHTWPILRTVAAC